MLNAVKRYLRIVGDQDDVLLVSLIQAAKQYLLNAGVAEPEEPDDGEPKPVYGASPRALYQLAVTLYVNMLYNGAPEDSLERAMTAIILQMKDYGGEDA